MERNQVTNAGRIPTATGLLAGRSGAVRPEERRSTLPPEVFVAAHSQDVDQGIRPDAPPGESRLDAVRIERLAALDLIAGEVGHELTHTLNLLRCLTEGTAAPTTLSTEDAALAIREVERLQRRLRQLRQLRLPPPAREPVRVLEVLRQATAELTHLITDKRIALVWTVEERLMLHTDRRLFYPLARDALGAVLGDAEPGEAIEVRTTLPTGAGGGSIEVSGAQRQPARSPEIDPFDPWVAMGLGVGGMDLVIAARIARTLGWRLSALRGEERCGLRILIPATSFGQEGT